MINIEFPHGETIDQAAKRLMAATMLDDNRIAQGTFNDILLMADTTSTPEGIVAYYHTECERRSEEWRNSPEGIKAQQEKEERDRRAAELNAEIDRIIAGRTMTFSDQNAWDVFAAKNTDSYGSGVVRYAQRWATLMEARMEDGSSLEDIAERASHDADNEGITGFMYGCAISILAQTWAYGEQLRRWHNLDAQIGIEGEKANESGGVLNPALLSITDQNSS